MGLVWWIKLLNEVENRDFVRERAYLCEYSRRDMFRTVDIWSRQFAGI
jgi:hypothetical protein